MEVSGEAMGKQYHQRRLSTAMGRQRGIEFRTPGWLGTGARAVERCGRCGNVHGGAVLKQLDQVAYACASRYAGRYVVTLSVDQVMFLQPIHVGELVTFLASVIHRGKSSMEIGI
jgi:hypothetical protein